MRIKHGDETKTLKKKEIEKIIKDFQTFDETSISKMNNKELLEHVLLLTKIIKSITEEKNKQGLKQI